ncbi:MAG: hypothetical protein IJD81_03735 [Oscillospiraceae bacterium]|nr:hypothetical protein [Oscillospiraceae bacterium]
MNIFKKVLRWLLPVPLILGTVGFLQQGQPLNDALFTAVTLYAMGYGDGGNCLPVEIARWAAPIMTASGLVLLVSQLQTRLRSFFLYLRGQAVAVYGGNEEAAQLLRLLDDRGIEGRDTFVKAQTYILTGPEADNLAFYRRHRRQLEHSSVYLKCSSLPAQATAPANLRLYCPEETAARLFWRQSDILALSKAHAHSMDIVIVGFGLLGEHLLTTALQQNIFSPDQTITYHIFGDDNGFAATHPQLKEISDPVRFHSEPWYTQLPLLEGAAMVIVAQQQEQTALVNTLMDTLTRDTLHILAADDFVFEILDGRSRMKLFCWEQEAVTPELIFSTKLYEDAMALNLAYAVRYTGSTRTAEEEWADLNGFTRYSNISSADYFKMLCALLRSEGQPEDFNALSDAWKQRLSELEHIRWCRYHYLNNWRCGTPADGKAKDAAKRIHRSLIPYAALSDGEKAKDLDNIALMFALSEN